MKIKKYYGNNNKDPWYLQRQVKWYLKLLKALINPKETCILCDRDVNKVRKQHNSCRYSMHVFENYIFCGECGQEYELKKAKIS